jgi:hypothetical protein
MANVIVVVLSDDEDDAPRNGPSSQAPIDLVSDDDENQPPHRPPPGKRKAAAPLDDAKGKAPCDDSEDDSDCEEVRAPEPVLHTATGSSKDYDDDDDECVFEGRKGDLALYVQPSLHARLRTLSMWLYMSAAPTFRTAVRTAPFSPLRPTRHASVTTAFAVRHGSSPRPYVCAGDHA